MSHHTHEPTDTHVKESGKGDLDDEMLPDEGKPMEQRDAKGGGEKDSAGEHGEMHPETARALDKKENEESGSR